MKNNEYNIVKINNENKNFQGEFTSSQSFEFSFQPENDDSFKDELNSKPVVNDKVEENLSKKAKEQEEKKKEKQDSQESENLTSSSSASGASSATAASAAGAGASAGGAIASVAAAASVSVAAIGAIVGINVLGPAQQEDLINFLSSNVTSTSIEFEFSMNNNLLSYSDPTSGDEPIGEKSVVYQIKDSGSFFKEDYIPFIETEYQDYFKYSAFISGLTPNTGYSLDIQIKEEFPEQELSEYQLLSHRTFVTPKTSEDVSSVEFVSIETTTDSVSFSFIISNKDARYDPLNPATPAIAMTYFTSEREYVGQNFLEESEYEVYDESHLLCSSSIIRLDHDASYILVISVSVEQAFIQLAETTFDTKHLPTPDFEWYGGDPVAKENSIAYKYIVNAEYIGYDPESETIPVVTAQVADVATGEVVAVKESNLQDFGSVVFVNEEVDGLTASTNYVLSIVFNSEVLGSYEFTTTERTTGFAFNDGYFAIGYDAITPRFYLKNAEINTHEEQGVTVSNINMTLTGGMAYSETKNVLFRAAGDTQPDLSYSLDYEFGGLSPNMTYTITVTNTDTGEVYGSIEVTTEERGYNPIGFAFDSFEKGSVSTEYNFSFHVNSSFATDANLMSVEVIPASGGDSVYSGQISGGLSQDETLLECTGSITGLEEGTAYIAGIYYTSSDRELIGVYNFETDPNPYGFRFLNNSFEIEYNEVTFAIEINESVFMDIQGVFASIREDGASQDLTGNLVSFDPEPTGEKLTGIVHFTGLSPNTDYVITIMEDQGNETIYGTKTITTPLEPASSFSSLNNGDLTYYYKVIDNQIYIPISCQYSDPTGKYTNTLSVKFVPNSSQTTEFFGSIAKSTNYQYLVISGLTMTNYMGSPFQVFVYNENETTNQLLKVNNVSFERDTDRSYNRFYYGQISPEVMEDGGAANLSLSLIYLYGNDSVTKGPQIKFAKSSDYSIYYTFNIVNLANTTTVNMASSLAESYDSSTFTSFNDVQAAMSDIGWDVILIWNDGSADQTICILTQIQLSFLS